MKSLLSCLLMLFMTGCATIQLNTASSTAAVVVGVQNGYAGQCPGALIDASRMTKLLSTYTTNVTLLVEGAATRDAVVEHLKEAVSSNELTIFYYSGHGGSCPSVDGFEIDGRDEYLCLFDTRLIDNDIWDIVSSTTNRVMFIADCCHSATLFRMPRVVFKSAKSGNASNLLCWSGCQDNASSYGNAFGGIFTNAILDNARYGITYREVWTKVSTDKNVLSKQLPNKTVTGSFNEDISVFR